jgi:hypothetical protein
VENETRVAIEPGTNVGVFVSCIVVENDVDDLADRNLRLDVVEKSNEFLMTMTLHVAADDRAIEDVEGGKQCRGAVPLVIVCHGSEPSLLQRQPWLGAIEGLNLAHMGICGSRCSIQDAMVNLRSSLLRIQSLSPFA